MSHLPRVLSAVGSGALTPASEHYLAREPATHGELHATVDSFDTDETRAALATAEVLVTGWRPPRIATATLDAARQLTRILHVAGSVKEQFIPEIWERGIEVSSAVDANAAPVAEFTLAAILMANKRIVQIAREYRERRSLIDQAELGVIGSYRRRVGIVGASRIGRRVIELLRPFDLEVVLYDPTLTAEAVAELGVTALSLEELCATSDIVTVHAPSIPATRGMISAELIDSMPAGSAL